MNTQWLPGRPIVAFALIPMFTIFAVWLVSATQAERNLRASEQELELQGILNEVNERYNTRDTDGDLLQDWEEFLYQTDIEKTDTDGDGLDDYNEVLDPIRDPLVSDAELGRHVASSSDSVIGDNVYYEEDQSLSATAKFARDIINTYVQLGQTDSLGTGVQSIVADKVSQNVDARERHVSNYTYEDLMVVPDEPKYRDLYKVVLSKAMIPFFNISTSDLFLLARYQESGESSYLEEMEANLRHYETFIEQALLTPVPEEIKAVHLELINHTQVLVQNIEGMLEVDNDPLGAMISAGDYSSDNQALAVVVQALRLYFTKN